MDLKFHRGTIVLNGQMNIPNTKWDSRSKCYRAQALFYRDIIEYLEASNIQYNNNVTDLIPCPHLNSAIKLRDYQQEAVQQWLKWKKGVIIMPTGSGKTMIAIKIIQAINSSTFIVVPTLNLVEQWKKKLKEAFNIEIGEYTGEKKDLLPITVSTYHSANLNAEHLGNKYNLLIFDEVHHLPSEGYRQIAEMFASPYRLGLTATFERGDGLHNELIRLIGGIVYEIQVDDLSGKYLADYEIIRVKAGLTEEEVKEYEKTYTTFREFLRSRNLKLKSAQDFKKIIMLSGRDPEARNALLSRNRAERICYNSANKLEKIKEILNKKNRTIIFTRFNDMAYNISKKFLIPVITYKTAKEERNEILKKFKEGTYAAIVASQVLDEGIDIPEANVGIIISGTGSSREFIQRLGRLLRPKEGKKAILYELVSQATMEVKTSYRRKK